MKTEQLPNDAVEFMCERISHYMNYAKEHHAAGGVWPQHETFATDLVKSLQRMVVEMKKKQIIHLRLDVGVWLNDYAGFKNFVQESEVLEKILATQP